MFQGTKEVQVNMKTIDNASKAIKEVAMSREIITNGLSISKLATQHPKEVPMTPLAKHGLQMAGDLKSGERLLTDTPITRFEKWLTDTCRYIDRQMCGHTIPDHYNNRLPLLDPELYWVDCELNVDPEKWRDVKPGQVEEINKMLLENYVRPTKELNLYGMIDHDPNFKRSVELVTSELPVVVASHELREINLPFMSKHTNVGYPYFRNDKTQVPNSNDNYATLTMREALSYKDKFEEVTKKYLVATEFARFQRGKGRLIIATSRIPNLVYNQLESEEIQTYKVKCPLFAGYNDASYLRKVLTEMADACLANGWIMYNVDYHRYDAHIVREFNILNGAQRMCCGGGERSKSIALWRAVSGLRTTLMAGTLGRPVQVYGRKFSGELDTNAGGGVINADHMTYQLMDQDLTYLRDIVNKVAHRMLVMGDDNLFICKPDFDLKRLSRTALSRFNFEIDDPVKNAFGVKFLQYRLFEFKGKRTFIYPWTRVFRSMLFKERPSNLGFCGWTLAFYQQLDKLRDCPEILAIVVNLAAYLDEKHLMLNASVADIISGSLEEDAEREKLVGKRSITTSERLNDGDPSKAEQFSREGSSLDGNYFEIVQRACRQVYDPNWLQKHNIPELKS